jgi:regulator of replication initiation timing
MAIANMNAFYTVLRKAEKSLSLLPSKCESLNTLSLKSKINYLTRDSAKLRKELTRATKRLNDKDTFILKLKREVSSLKSENKKISEENSTLKYKNSQMHKKAEQSKEAFLEFKLTHTVNLDRKDKNFNAYKIKMEEKFKNCVSHYEAKLAQKDDYFSEKLARKDNYIDQLKSNRSEGASGSVARPPPTESDYESEEVWLPAEKCAIYPAPGWLDCKNKTCGHRHAPVRTRQKSNRLKKKKGGARANISKGDSFKKEMRDIAKSRKEYEDQKWEHSRLSTYPTKDPEKAYADLIALSNKMNRIEDPKPGVRKGVGSTSWVMADVD